MIIAMQRSEVPPFSRLFFLSALRDDQDTLALDFILSLIKQF